MSVVVSNESAGPCLREIKIEVPAPAVEAETERVVVEYRKQAKVQGFRPGKAPVQMVRDRYRKEIEQEVVERLVPRYWQQAQAEAGIEPLTGPELAGVEPPKLAGQPLVFTARVETRPEITLGNVRDFTLPEMEVEPTDEERQAALDDLRRQLGSWGEVDRPAGTGDLVTIEVVEEGAPEAAAEDAEGAEEGEPAAREPQTVDVEVGSPQVWEELSVAVTGLAAGQKGTFSRTETPPAPVAAEGEEGQTPPAPEATERSFRFEVRRVQERELPEVDDELAKKVGDFETVADLEAAVADRIRHQKGEQRANARERALLDQLRERHPVELPRRVVFEEIQGMLNDYAQNLARQGVDVENAPFDWQKMGEEIRPAAEKKVHARLVLDAVAEELELSVGADELERVLAQFAQSQGASTQAVRQSLDRDGRLGEIKARLLRSKTIRHLMGEDTTLAPEPPAASEASETQAAPEADSQDDSEE